MSARSQILDAMFSVLIGVGGAVLRNSSLPASVPDGAMVIMRDGTADDPKVFFGGAHLLEFYRHAVDVEIVSDSVTPEAEIYGIADEIKSIVRADRTLGGLADDVDIGEVTVGMVSADDGAPLVAGTLQVVLHYTLEVAA